MAINLPRISARNLPTVIDAAIHYPNDIADGVAILLEISTPEADNLVTAARLLGILGDDHKPSEVASLIGRASVVERRTLLRFYLEAFQPFAFWKRRLAQGFDVLEAGRQARLLFEITNAAADIRDWFIDVGMFCGSLQEENHIVTVVSGKEFDLGGVVSDVLNRSESATAVLERYVGPGVWQGLPESTREHLVGAVTKLSENADSDEVVRLVGQAVDAYLIHVGETDAGGYTASKLTMGQAADRLENDGVIVSKQRQLLGYGLALRNAAEHPDTDPDLNGGRWSINPKSAQTYLRALLDTIRSIEGKRSGRFEI